MITVDNAATPTTKTMAKESESKRPIEYDIGVAFRRDNGSKHMQRNVISNQRTTYTPIA